MTTVYIAIPTLGGWIRVELAHALRQMSHDGRHRLLWAQSVLNMRPMNCARHDIINRCLETDADFLLMLDADAVPYRNPLDLIGFDLDVVAMACPIWRPGSRPPVVLNARPVDGSLTVDMDAAGPLVEVSQASTSVILIARRVLEHPAMKNPFVFEYGEDGVITADDDIGFYRRARAAGFRLWVSLDHVCGHVKEVDIADVHNAVERWRDHALDKR